MEVLALESVLTVLVGPRCGDNPGCTRRGDDCRHHAHTWELRCDAWIPSVMDPLRVCTPIVKAATRGALVRVKQDVGQFRGTRGGWYASEGFRCTGG